MKHYFDKNGKELPTPPDPFEGRSPMHKPDGSYNDDAFREMGGTITEDGEPTPKEKFISGLDDYLDELEEQAEALALDITVDEFKQAASTMMSADLINWAKTKGVPDEMIELVRGRILAFVADASRIGMTWGDIFPPENK